MTYSPKPPPRTKPEFQDLYDYLEQELQSISRALLETPELELRTTHGEPVRPREGMIVQADGTNWDPGEGAGTYKYEAGNWVRFGDATHVHTLVDITDAGALAALDEVDVDRIGPIATDRILGRDTAGAGDAEELTLSQVLDFVGSAAHGDILFRGASSWTRLPAGTTDYFLQTKGASADPVWGQVTTYPIVRATSVDADVQNVAINDVPAGVKRVVLLLNGITPRGSLAANPSELYVRIGPSGGVETTGYASVSSYGGTGGDTTFTTGFLMMNGPTENVAYTGRVVLENISGNIWLCSGILGVTDSTSYFMTFFTGVKTIAGELNKITVCVDTSSNAFNAGTVTAFYEK